MLKRTLFFSSPGRLGIRHSQLFYEGLDLAGNQVSRTFPVEDLGFVVVESHQILVTACALDALAQANCAVVFCDAAHSPASMLLPFAGNERLHRNVEFQIRASDALKGRLWRQLVQAKIRNQCSALRYLGIEIPARLSVLEGGVSNGDSENLEGQAARIYFRALMPDPAWNRDRNGPPPNPALNYGYAILRAAVARALVGSGLLGVFGLHHHNQYNPFCLADDVMEPFRPFVDALVFSNRGLFADPAAEELTVEMKHPLLALLASDVSIGGQTRPLLNAASLVSASLVRCLEKTDKTLRLPAFPPCMDSPTPP